jgi:oxaloacetate decarboxylase gamma subunit
VDDNLIGQGLELMLFGMGTVVVFLTLLVFITSAMSKLVERFSPAPATPPPGTGRPPEDAALLAVISAAVHRHRSRRKP